MSPTAQRASEPDKRDHRAEWWSSLNRVKAYTAAHGFPRQRTVTEEGWRPGKWVAKQKERWATLDEDQRGALLEVDGFALDAREAHFEQMVAAVVAARDAGIFPTKDTTYHDRPIGQWLHDLRRGKITCTADREAKLRAARIL